MLDAAAATNSTTRAWSSVPNGRALSSAQTTPWRDPRMIIGLLLIVGSMVAGGFAVAAADHTVSYWAVRTSVHEGDVVSRSDFTAVQAKVPKRTAQTLVRTNAVLPHRLGRMVWAESLPGGTLISRDQLATRGGLVEVPVTVATGGAPADLRRGDIVDVWVSPGDRESAPTKAVKVLSRARVVSRANSGGFDGGPATTVVVDAAGTRVDGALIAAASSGRVSLVRLR